MITISTLSQIRDKGYALYGHCRCGRGRKLDMDALIEWLGPDYDVVNETRIAAAFRCGSGHKGGVITLAKAT